MRGLGYRIGGCDVVTATEDIVWSSPRHDVPTLLTVGDQISIDDSWHTVIGVHGCRAGHDRLRDGVCVVVQFGHSGHHFGPGSLLWIRRRVVRP